MKYTKALLLLFPMMLMLTPTLSNAQLAVSNLMEYQLGNLPDTDPNNYTTSFDQLQLDYYHDDIVIGLRFESFTSPDTDREFSQFRQRYVEWNDDGVRLRVGNFYGMLGRGLIFRAFELPGVVQEDASLRVRYGLSRDMDGVYFEYNRGPVQLKLLRGEASNSAIPPNIGESLTSLGLVEGGELSVQANPWIMFGGAYARYTPESRQPFESGSGFMNLSFSPLTQKISPDLFIDFYVEQARKQAHLNNALSTSDNNAHALYMSMNVLFHRLGISYEHKDYHDFNFRLNDPVPLVREHTFYLLNRATHKLLPEDEKGHRVELNYSFPFGTSIMLNHNRAENKPFLTANFISEEWFLELDHEWHESVLTKVFVDKAQDEYPSESIADRLTAGGFVSLPLGNTYGLQFDLQAQETKKTFEFAPGKDNFIDLYAAITFSRSPDFAIGFEIQRTGDPLVTDDIDTFYQVEIDPKFINALNLNYHINDSHELFLFYGERRGGWACTAGTCYPVLAFKGLELRLQSRF